MLTSLLDLNIQTLFTGINIPINVTIDHKRVLSLLDRNEIEVPLFNINHPFYSEIKTTLITESVYLKNLIRNILLQFKPEMGEIQNLKSNCNEVTLFFYPREASYRIRNDNAYTNYINLSHQLIKFSYLLEITNYIGVVSGDNLFSELMFQLGVLQQIKYKNAYIFILNHSIDVCDFNVIQNAVENVNVKIFLLSSKPMFGINLQKIIQADGQTIVDRDDYISTILQEKVSFISTNCALSTDISLYSIMIYTFLSVLEYQNLQK